MTSPPVTQVAQRIKRHQRRAVVLMQFRVQALACVANQQPKRYHPTRAARVGTPGLML